MKKCFRISLVLRTDKERQNGECPLYVKIMLNGKFFAKLSTGESIAKQNWDGKAQRTIGKGFGLLDYRLDTIVTELENYISEQKNKNNDVTKEMIVAFFKKEDKQCFYKFFDETFCKTKFVGLAKATKESYHLLRKRLKEYKPNLSLQQIDLNFVIAFNDFLIHKKNTGKGGVWNRMKNFRTVVKMAYDMNLINEYPFKQFKLDKPDAKNIALTKEECTKIIEADLGNKKHLEDARDLFLFACNTGFRFSDVMNLKWENIKNGVLSIEQIKTKHSVNVPINKLAKKIIGKNEKCRKLRPFVFARYSNQRVNKNLKTIAEIAEVDKHLCFHLSRHTFGTILGLEKQSAFLIRDLMGHKKISSSAIYVNMDVDGLKKTMKKINFGM